jgi:hypothetical protein
MPHDSWLADGVEVTVSGAFTTHHRLDTAAGSLGEFTLAAFRRGGIYRAADGRELSVRPAKWWRGWYELSEGGIVLASARPRGAFRREILIEFGRQEHTLLPAGLLRRGWLLSDGTGTVLLEIQPRGVFRRGAYLTILAPVDADLLAFAYYLVQKRWQEESAAAHGAAAGGS